MIRQFSDYLHLESVQLDYPKFDYQTLQQLFFDYLEVQRLIGAYSLKLKSQDDLLWAFTHKSSVNEFSFITQDNERLEFLGDSVLQLLVSEELFLRHPDIDEGTLSKMRSAIVNEKSLANLARSLNFSKILVLGKGEWKSEGNLRDSILADTFEALLGVIYKHEGLARAHEFLLKVLPETLFSLKNIETFDAKSKLQEMTMKLYGTTPKYSAVELKQGFEVSVAINGRVRATLQGISKKKAMQELAEKILKEKLYKEKR